MMLVYYMIFLKILYLIICINAAPKLQKNNKKNSNENMWPPMKNYDIWGGGSFGSSKSLSKEITIDRKQEKNLNNIKLSSHMINNVDDRSRNVEAGSIENTNETFNSDSSSKQRNGKVLNFFPVPMDEECLSNDGRRYGTCFNVYECRQKGGMAKGECAMGFGVCCVFIASCNQEIKMNITYITSPNFPSAMTTNLTTCKIKIKMINSDISQLRLDFHHFSLGQPNRKTGICDGDIFQMTGGLGGPFTLCGHNSGQHVYYDVGGRVTARQTMTLMNSVAYNVPASSALSSSSLPSGNNNNNNNSPDKNSNITPTTIQSDTSSSHQNIPADIEILMNFTNRIIPTRIWEIRILQIPFSQRAPAGCLQYYNGQEGIIQTFNFADNGRHLANQDYKACIRQEKDMCSITYEPCDEQSFRIGPSNLGSYNDELFLIPPPIPTSEDNNINASDMGIFTPETNMNLMVTDADNNNGSSLAADSISMNVTSEQPPSDFNQTQSSMELNTTTPMMISTETIEDTQTTPPTTIETDEPLNEEEIEEGSGGGNGLNDIPSLPSSTTRRTTTRRSPVGGGLDVFTFLTDVFDLRRRRSSRQFYSKCTDRITMPCIVEDFIGAGGIGTLPGCEPVHCGERFCSSGIHNAACKIESTVTPFYLGIHFGNGQGKGSPEDNIGACIRYNQLPCL